MSQRPSALLLVANWDSNVGYAWWLMESYWVALAEHYCSQNRVLLAYPSVSTLPKAIAQAPLQPLKQDFTGTSLRAIREQCSFIRRNGVRAIYFSDRPTWHWRYAVYRLNGVRIIIVHDHTPGLRTRPTFVKRCFKKLVQRLPWITADGLIAATDFVRDRLIQVNCAQADRCFVANNGLPQLMPAPEPLPVHSLFNIPDDRQILVMTGRANRYKGVQFVLACLQMLTDERRRSIHFLFCGDGPDLAYLVQLAHDLGVAGHVTFAGRRNDIPALLPGCDIAIHPSQGEVGYSLSILEYMRAGLPVLVPDNPSVCCATEHGVTGMVYPDGDIGTACALLTQLLEDPVLGRTMGQQAKMAVRHRYSLTLAHSALLTAFREVDQRQTLQAPCIEAQA